MRRIVCELHAELPKSDLVAWTSGNVSDRDPESGLVVIKPSGIRSPSCLLQSHGIFATGASAEAAVKAAVMTEDNAAIVWMALQLGQPMPAESAEIDRLYDRYQNVYGQ